MGFLALRTVCNAGDLGLALGWEDHLEKGNGQLYTYSTHIVTHTLDRHAHTVFLCQNLCHFLYSYLQSVLYPTKSAPSVGENGIFVVFD